MCHSYRQSYRQSIFAIPSALDHAHDNEVARAYDRGERFTQRVQLFNWWGEKLAAAQREEKIITPPGNTGMPA